VTDSDQLVISGGGDVAVGTDELFAASARLRRVEHELLAHLGELASIDRLLGSGLSPTAEMPSGVTTAERAMDDATALLARARENSGMLATALDRSADGYGLAEDATRRLTETAAAGLGYALGFALPLLALHALPVILGVAGVASFVVDRMPAGDRKALQAQLSTWLQEHSGVLSDPAFVTFVRLTVVSVDDVAAGLFHVPPGLEGLLDTTGVTGVAASSAAVVGLGSIVGYLKETPVRTVQVSSKPGGTLPTGWEDRAGRVPQGDAQVRIDRYQTPGQPDSFEVYVSGTRDFALGKDTQPWDMTSNMVGIAGGDPGSVRAVEQAMHEAGITSSSPVLFTGHSQGGLVAAILAGSGDYNVQGVYTLGAPAAQTTVPQSVPWLAVEHSNDIVPALSGDWTHSDPVVVTRQIYDGAPGGTDKFFPSHQLGAYESTAAMIDGSTEPRVAAVEQRFVDFTVGATPAESTTYLAVRVTG
jgi:hypothetical protein